MPIRVQVIGAEQLKKLGRMVAAKREAFMDDLYLVAEKFGMDAIARAKLHYLEGPRPQKLDRVTGRLDSSLRSQVTRKGNIIETKIGTDVEYAAIHEYGGVVRPTVTDKMREMAWGMFYESGDGKWKGLALTKKTKLNIRIPARPYLRPSIKDTIPSFEDNIRRILRKISFDEAA